MVEEQLQEIALNSRKKPEVISNADTVKIENYKILFSNSKLIPIESINPAIANKILSIIQSEKKQFRSGQYFLKIILITAICIFFISFIGIALDSLIMNTILVLMALSVLIKEEINQYHSLIIKI